MALSTEDPIGDGVRALALFFVGAGTLSDTLTRVAGLAGDALGADMAGITMLVDGRPRTGAFTDPTAVKIDIEQYETGRGPCMDAFRHGLVFRIDDTSLDQQWPEFSKMAGDHGVRSTLSLPLKTTDEPLGALNLYSRQVANFVGQDTAEAETLAVQATIVLANAAAFQDSRELNENLKQALTSRRTIDHAVGIVMSAGGRSPDEAFQVLVRASQRENRKLREIAAQIVDAAQHRLPPPYPEGP